MAEAPQRGGGRRILTQNRKARHDYTILDRIETGIELVGTEVKVVREGKASLNGAYAAVDKRGELYLHSVTIPPYDFGNRFNHDSLRVRKLLVHRAEARKLKAHVEQKGNTLVPLSLYLVKGRVKVELAICRGKAVEDKRETLRRRDADRDAQRAIAQHFRG
jgi:SsrA-binding protein